MRCRVNFATESIYPVTPQFVNHGLSAIDVLNKIARIWSPITRIIRLTDVTNWSEGDCAVVQVAAVGDSVGDKSDYSEENYKNDFEILMEIPNFNPSTKY